MIERITIYRNIGRMYSVTDRGFTQRLEAKDFDEAEREVRRKHKGSATLKVSRVSSTPLTTRFI